MMQRYSLQVIGYGLALASALALAGCVSEDFLGDTTTMVDNTSAKISFQSGTGAVTRNALSGAAAATALNKNMVVYGTKHVNAEDKTTNNDAIVFNQYHVAWIDNSASSTSTNTHNWDYIGQKSYISAVTNQTEKVWDYDAANGYTFYAFSSKGLSYPATKNDSVIVTKITYGSNSVFQKGYNLTISKNTNTDGIYFADRKTVDKSDFGKPVQFTFREFGVKVRVGFYETIPGYKVKINRFYYSSSAKAPVTSFADMTSGTTKYFRAAFENVKTGSDQKYTITYNDAADGLNKPMTFYNSNNKAYYLSFGEKLMDTELGTTAANATYDQADGAFNSVFPYTSATQPMLILCDYTITSEETTEETLTVTGAKVVVPTEYMKWDSGHSYTYLFKISLATTGTTGESGDPEGLFPISFDGLAVATDDNDQTNLITVDNYSVTTLRYNGIVYVVNTNKSTGDIYLPTGIGAESGKAQLYYVTTTGEPISEATIYARLKGTVNGLTLSTVTITSGAQAGQPAAKLVHEVPAADGSYYTFGTADKPGALMFTPESGKVYAYVYCEEKYVSPTYEQCTSSSTYSATTQYYSYENGIYFAIAVSESEFNADKSKYFIKTDDGKPGKYAVMMMDTRY